MRVRTTVLLRVRRLQLPGAVLGGLVIAMIESFNNGLEWMTPGPDWSQSIIFSILILILVFRPEGLLGERTPEGA